MPNSLFEFLALPLIKEILRLVLGFLSIVAFVVVVGLCLYTVTRPVPCKPGFVIVNGYCVTGYKPE